MPITIDFIAWMATRDTREKHFRCDTGRKSRRWNLFVPREIYAEGPSLRVFFARFDRSPRIRPAVSASVRRPAGYTLETEVRARPATKSGSPQPQ
jgi:hypothetical protein